MHTHRPEVSGSDSHLGTRCVFCFYSTRDDFPPNCTTVRRWWLFLDHDDALNWFLKLQDWDQMIFHLLPIGGFCYSRFTGFFVRVIIVYTSVYFFHFLSQNFARLCYPAKKRNNLSLRCLIIVWNDVARGHCLLPVKTAFVNSNKIIGKRQIKIPRHFD